MSELYVGWLVAVIFEDLIGGFRCFVKWIANGDMDERQSIATPTPTESFPYLYHCHEEIEIDVDRANEIMEQIYLKELDEGKIPQAILELKLMSRKAAIESLYEKRFYFKQDKTVQRLHTNITGLKREARKCLTWKGKELINVDISNSQGSGEQSNALAMLLQRVESMVMLEHIAPPGS